MSLMWPKKKKILFLLLHNLKNDIKIEVPISKINAIRHFNNFLKNLKKIELFQNVFLPWLI